jgi:4-hydroxy-2-oxoglutarate aldolase
VRLRGVFPPATTPFDADGGVDERALAWNLDRYVQSRVAGIVVLGTNGEAALLDDDECDSVVGMARSAVPEDRTLIAGCARESTRATITAVGRAADLGADFVLVRTPSFFKSQMSGDALALHYTAVADASPVPVLLYNFATLTGVTLPIDTIARLAEHPNVAGIKESDGDVGRVAEVAARTPATFTVFGGSVASFYPSLCVGAHAGILALSCVVPELCVELFELAAAARHDEARQLQNRLTPLSRAVTTTFGIAGLKAAMDLVGYRGGLPRPPLLPLTAPARDRIQALLSTVVV